ncbi:hypothetical protein ACIP69_18165 [Streptomyces hygroscopicus]|uniref:hypothetical protein n=1 Tax=Streptomyces hygroscopicus TaxID=1912 RepID=UPI00380A07AB
MTTINERMASLQIAASGAITDYSDVAVRGYLKEHPDFVVHRLDLLAEMIEQVRTAVIRERNAGQWGTLAADPAEEHAAETADYSAHSCDCDFCLRGGA